MHTIDLEKATAFVLNTNDPVLSSLAQYVNGQFSREQAIEALKIYQRADGGWTKTDKDFQGDLSIISTTWMAIQWLHWLEDQHSPVLLNTLNYLRKTQREDGSWDEPEEILNFDPPFWMLPGRYENQVWLTAALCCKLKESGQEHQVDFAKAVEFIRRGWDGEKFPVYLHTHWMAMPLLHLVESGNEADAQIIQGCKKLLYAAVENDEVDQADMISIAYASHLSGDRAQDLFELSLHKVKGNQQDDGGWTTNHGDEHRAGCTVDALFLFKKIGLT